MLPSASILRMGQPWTSKYSMTGLVLAVNSRSRLRTWIDAGRVTLDDRIVAPTRKVWGGERVVVCEGFVGNVLLKAGEGAVEFLFSTLKEELARLLPRLGSEAGQAISGGLTELKTRFEYQEFGGGPLLGIRGACIICHGSSGARAIKNALRIAGTMAEDRLNQLIVEHLQPPQGD